MLDTTLHCNLPREELFGWILKPTSASLLKHWTKQGMGHISRIVIFPYYQPMNATIKLELSRAHTPHTMVLVITHYIATTQVTEAEQVGA